MNTRAIIMFMDEAVEIIDEFYGEGHTLVTKRQRIYPYSTMTPRSYTRLMSLYTRPQAAVVLVSYGKQKYHRVIIMWKREQGRIYLDDRHTY